MATFDYPIADTFSTEQPLSTSGANRDASRLPFAFLLLFTIAVYARPEDIFHLPFHFQLIFGGLGIIVLVLGLLTRKVRLHWTPELAFIFLLTFWFTLGVPFAFWRSGSLEVFTGTWLKTLLIFFLLTQTVTSISRLRKLLWAIILSELLVTCISLVLQNRSADGRLVGINAELLAWNFFGIAVAISLPYMAALYVARKSALRTGTLLLTIGVMMWMLIQTASRGGFLNVLFSVALTGWFILRNSGRGRIVWLIVASALVISVMMAPGLFWTRIQTIWDSSRSSNSVAEAADESTDSRKFLLQRAMIYTLRNPFLGVGIGNFPLIDGKELRRPDAWFGTHNTLTQLSSEAGIPALIMFLAMMFAAVKHLRRVGQEFQDNADQHELWLMARATLVSILSVGFACFFVHMAYGYYFYYPVGIAAGLWTMSRKIAAARLADEINAGDVFACGSAAGEL